MGAAQFRDLRVWQHADEIRKTVIALCQRPTVARDFSFRDQIESASNSACRNLAEGFGRQTHREFAQFCVIAIGSLHELLDLLEEAKVKRHIDEIEFKSLTARTQSTIRQAHGLRRYLANTRGPYERRRR